MTPQESAMLNDLMGKVQGTRLTEKDPDAQAMIENTVGNNPDSLYILAQTVLVQNIALGQARSQVEQLKQQVAGLTSELEHHAPSRVTSFLGSLLGHNDPPPRAQVIPPPPQPRPYTATPPYQPVAYQPVQGYPAAPAGFGPFGGGGLGGASMPGGGGFGGPPSFLRSAATTAAGVAAGALAFEGVESLLHGFGHGGSGLGMMGGGGFGGSAERPFEENVVNNYYGGDGGGSGELHDHHAHEASYDERPDASSTGMHDGVGRFDDASFDSSRNATFGDAGYGGSGGESGDNLSGKDYGDDVGATDLSAPDPGDETAFDDGNDNLADNISDDAGGGDSFDDGGGGDLS